MDCTVYVDKTASINLIFSTSNLLLFYLSIFGCLRMVEQTESLLHDKILAIMQAIVYRRVAFIAVFLNKNMGRLQLKNNGLGPDNKKWVGSDKEVGRFRQLSAGDLC